MSERTRPETTRLPVVALRPTGFGERQWKVARIALQHCREGRGTTAEVLAISEYVQQAISESNGGIYELLGVTPAEVEEFTRSVRRRGVEKMRAIRERQKQSGRGASPEDEQQSAH